MGLRHYSFFYTYRLQWDTDRIYSGFGKDADGMQVVRRRLH